MVRGKGWKGMGWSLIFPVGVGARDGDGQLVLGWTNVDTYTVSFPKCVYAQVSPVFLPIKELWQLLVWIEAWKLFWEKI